MAKSAGVIWTSTDSLLGEKEIEDPLKIHSLQILSGSSNLGVYDEN